MSISPNDKRKAQSTPNEWTINLKSICEAASRNEVKEIRSCWNDANNNCFSSNTTGNQKTTTSSYKRGGVGLSGDIYFPSSSFANSHHDVIQPSSNLSSTLLHLLFYPNSTTAKNCRHYFSDVIINSTRVIKDLDDDDDDDDDDEEEEQNIKFQLSMSFRTLLFIPIHYATPWDTLMIFITLLSQHHTHEQILLNGNSSRECLFIYYCYTDVTFMTTVLNDIRDFFHEIVMHEFISLKNNTKTTSHNTTRHGSNLIIGSIESILIDLFATTVNNIFYRNDKKKMIMMTQHEGSISNNNIDNDKKRMVENQNEQWYTILIEMSEALILTANSMDSYQRKGMKRNVVPEMMDLLFSKDDDDDHDDDHEKEEQYNYVAYDDDDDNGFFQRYKRAKAHDHKMNELISLDNILALLTLCSGITNHMTSWHWARLRVMVQNALQQVLQEDIMEQDEMAYNSVPSIDFSQMFMIVLNFTLSDDHHYDAVIRGEMSRSDSSSWIGILVDIYCLLRGNQDAFHEVETYFIMKMSRLSKQKVEQFVHIITTHATNERYGKDGVNIIHCDRMVLDATRTEYMGACNNLLFLIVHSQMESKVFGIEKILVESFEEQQQGDISVIESVSQSILSLNDLDNNHTVSYAQNVFDVQDSDWKELRAFFQAIFYQSNGEVKLTSSSAIRDYLKPAIEKMIHFIQCTFCFLDRRMTRRRVQVFIDVADSLLERICGNGVSDLNKILLSSSIFISIFGEALFSRFMIINHFAESMMCSQEVPQTLHQNSKKNALYCWMLFTFINTMESQCSKENKCFEPLLSLIQSKRAVATVMPCVLSELIDALSWHKHYRLEVLVFAETMIQPMNNNHFKAIISTEESYHLGIKALLSLIQERGAHDNTSEQCHKIDTVCIEALTCIVKMILLNKPMQTIHFRSIMFSELSMLVERNAICHWVSMRLWTAIAINLLGNFQITKFTQKIGDTTEQNQGDSLQYKFDIACLLRLTIVLMKKVATVATLDEAQNKFTNEEISIFFNPKQIALMVKENVNLKLINLMCYRTMIEDVLPLAPPSTLAASFCPTQGMDSESGSSLDVHSLQTQIFKNECKAISEIICNSSKGSIPFWSESYDVLLTTCLKVPPSPTGVAIAPIFDPVIYDILSAFLIDMIDAVIQSADQMINPNSRIIWLFQNLSTSQCIKYQRIPDKFDASITAKYFLLAAEILQILLTATKGCVNDALRQLKAFVAAINAFCETIQSYCRECNEHDYEVNHEGIETMQAIWKFYNSSCNEIACCNMIDFIESCMAQTDKIGQEDSEMDCFLSPMLIYNFVRKYRESFLSCFGSIFQLFEKLNTWQNRKVKYFMFCADLACTFTVDLCSGFKATSGGMTKSLYGCYVQTIEDAIIAALKIDPLLFMDVDAHYALENSLVLDLQKNCHAASEDLWDAVYSVDIRSPIVFKVTMRICLVHLPQLTRRIDRIAIGNFPGALFKKGNCHEVRVLELCIQNTIIKNKGENCDSKSRVKSNAKKSYRETVFNKILKSNKMLLERTHEYSLLSIENTWSDVIERINDIDINASACKSSARTFFINKEVHRLVSSHILQQQYILSLSLAAIETQLRSNLQTKKPNTSRKEIDLPPSIERRICSCLVKVVIALKISIRLIMQKKFNAYAVLKISAAIACVRSWLTPTTLAGLISEYHSKIARLATVRNSPYNRSLEVRLSKVVRNMGEICEALRQLKQLLEKSNNFGNDLDFIFHESLLAYRENNNLSDQECSNLLQLINIYISTVDGNQFSQKSFQDDFAENEKNLRVKTNNIMRKRLREARRDKRRSKNNVIGEWMYLDCELEEDKKDIDNEDYEDLEDFILPG